MQPCIQVNMYKKKVYGIHNSDVLKCFFTGTKMLRKILASCVVVFLTLRSVYTAREKLNDIWDLKECQLSKQTNIVKLLQWFANEVYIEDNSNTIQLTFNPNSDYGSHHYGNYEGLLDSPPEGCQYYTVGNTKKGISKPLPSCVRDTNWIASNQNRARIIFRVRQGSFRQIIDQVYITQHVYSNQSSYDPGHTYEVTVNILRDLRRDHYTQLQSYRNQDECNWGLCCAIFGCVIFIIIAIFTALGIYLGHVRK